MDPLTQHNPTPALSMQHCPRLVTVQLVLRAQRPSGLRQATLVGQGGAWAGVGSGIPTIVLPITARNSSRESFATFTAGTGPADGAVAGGASAAPRGATRARTRRRSSFFI